MDLLEGRRPTQAGTKADVQHGRHRHQARRQGPDQGLHEGARQADVRRRRRAPDRQRSAAHRAGRGALPGVGADGDDRAVPRRRPPVPPDACPPTAGTCSSSSRSARWRARWSGVGSVGTRAWILLLHGPRHEDVLFLQAKEAEASVLERFTKKSQYDNHGARVVAGQRLMQASSDIFLGWQRANGVDGVTARLLHPPAPGLEGVGRHRERHPRGHEGLRRAVRPHAWPGPTPARGTASPWRRISAANATFERRWPRFAESYADQNERDYEAFAAACKSGRLHAEEGI